MDISIIISSFNQYRRLRLCLESLAKQEVDGISYEIIIADDNSTDDTLNFVSSTYPSIIVSLNDKSESNTYTLADNWNAAAKLATGDRIVFSNADMIFCKTFLKAHLDPIMQDSIIFGPGYSSAPPVDNVLDNFLTAKEIIDWIASNNLLGRDRHSEGSADTYNKEWTWQFPFGYNFSVIRDQFNGVGGFPSFKKWGHEEVQLCKKIVEKYKTSVKSNKNAVAVHLWHPRVNHENMTTRTDNIRF